MKYMDIIAYIQHIMQSTFQFFYAKMAWAVPLTFAFLYNPDNFTAYVALFVLITADFFTGVHASRCEGKPIQSRIIRRTVFKYVIYFGTVSCGHLTDVILNVPAMAVEYAILSYLAITELVSILENTGRAGFVAPKVLLEKLLMYRDGKVNGKGETI